MSFLDELFGNVAVDPEGYAGPQNAYAESAFTGGVISQMNNLFKDKNFVRGLGEAGKAVSSGGNAGQVLGDFSTNLIRRRQTQTAADKMRKERAKDRNLFEELLKDPSKYVGPKEDNSTADSINFTGDTATMKFSNAPQKLGYKTNQPLEGMRRPQSGGSDLPDFSNQSSGGDIDFAGLDPEDISMLLKAEQQFGELNQRDIQLLLQERGRKEDIANKTAERAATLKSLAEEKLATSMQQKRESVAKIEAAKTLQDRLDARERLQARLKDEKTLTPEEKRKAILENKKLSKEILKIEAETRKIGTAVEITPAQILALDKETQETMSKIDSAGIIFNKEKVPKVSVEQGAQLASFENNKPGIGVVYATEKVPTVKESWLWDFGLMDKTEDIEIPKPYMYPKDLMFFGKPATGAEIIKRAKAANMTVPEFLEKINNARK